MTKTRTHKNKQGFTLVEVLIVVVIMAILAATIVPQFSNATGDAKLNTAKFNLNTLRGQVEMYKSQHGGLMPSSTLAELLTTTNAAGAVGTGTGYTYGPYISAIPQNPLANSATVALSPNLGATPTTTVAGAGWLYDTQTGKIWCNDLTSPQVYPFSAQ